jgi:hypothetical protein
MIRDTVSAVVGGAVGTGVVGGADVDETLPDNERVVEGAGCAAASPVDIDGRRAIRATKATTSREIEAQTSHRLDAFGWEFSPGA